MQIIHKLNKNNQSYYRKYLTYQNLPLRYKNKYLLKKCLYSVI